MFYRPKVVNSMNLSKIYFFCVQTCLTLSENGSYILVREIILRWNECLLVDNWTKWKSDIFRVNFYNILKVWLILRQMKMIFMCVSNQTVSAIEDDCKKNKMQTRVRNLENKILPNIY